VGLLLGGMQTNPIEFSDDKVALILEARLRIEGPHSDPDIRFDRFTN
jgi:hypothetical protein